MANVKTWQDRTRRKPKHLQEGMEKPRASNLRWRLLLASLTLAVWALGSSLWLSDTSAAVAEAATAPPRATPSLPVPPVPSQRNDKLVPAPSYRLLQEENSETGAVQVYREATPEEHWEEFARRALVALSPEEEELLREARSDQLSDVIARAEHAFLNATDEDRTEKEHRYIMALNLIPKLEAALQEPPPEWKALQQRYFTELEARRKEWSKLNPDERVAREVTFKEMYFSAAQKEGATK